MKREYEIESITNDPSRGLHENHVVHVLPLDSICGEKKAIAEFKRKKDAVLFVRARIEQDAAEPLVAPTAAPSTGESK